MTTGRVYVVYGIPRSGKNSMQILRAPNSGRRFVAKGRAAQDWMSDAMTQIAVQRGLVRPIVSPVHVHIAAYQPRETPDGDNVQSLVWDALVKAKIIDDDSLVVKWSGEKHVGKARHRVEITVTPLTP